MSGRSKAVRFDGVTTTVNDEEADALGPLMTELEELASCPFAHDPKPGDPPLPEHFVSPAKIRAVIAARLAHLRDFRRELFTTKLLKALTLNGVAFLDVEAGASVERPVRELVGHRSRVMRS